ncbi:hypothetical protein Pcinc_035918, partial [Petrolisthes cinctipes]
MLRLSGPNHSRLYPDLTWTDYTEFHKNGGLKQ